MDEETNSLKLNALERRVGLDKAIALYERNVSKSSDEDNAFERSADIYKSRNQLEDEIRILERAVAFYEQAVFVERLESKLPVLNQFTRRLRAAKSILSSQKKRR